MARGKPGGAFFPVLFGLVGLMFIGILVGAYILTQRAHPVLLDGEGQVQKAP